MSTLKLRKFPVIIASSLFLWTVEIASVNAAQLTFVNQTGQIATDFHLKIQLNGRGFDKTLDSKNGFIPVAVGGIFILSESLSQGFISAEGSFAKGNNKPANPSVPEPTTILGTVTALDFGAFFRQQKSKKQ